MESNEFIVEVTLFDANLEVMARTVTIVGVSGDNFIPVRALQEFTALRSGVAEFVCYSWKKGCPAEKRNANILGVLMGLNGLIMMNRGDKISLKWPDNILFWSSEGGQDGSNNSGGVGEIPGRIDRLDR